MRTAIGFAALGFALMGGVYFTFSGFVMRSLADLPGAAGVAAMQSINRVILSSAFMPVFWGTTLTALALAIWAAVHRGFPGAGMVCAAGVIYFVGMFVCTALFNVPLNDRLDAIDPSGADLALWADYLVRWTRWSHVRTVASMVAAGLCIAAALIGPAHDAAIASSD